MRMRGYKNIFLLEHSLDEWMNARNTCSSVSEWRWAESSLSVLCADTTAAAYEDQPIPHSVMAFLGPTCSFTPITVRWNTLLPQLLLHPMWAWVGYVQHFYVLVLGQLLPVWRLQPVGEWEDMRVKRRLFDKSWDAIIANMALNKSSEDLLLGKWKDGSKQPRCGVLIVIASWWFNQINVHTHKPDNEALKKTNPRTLCLAECLRTCSCVCVCVSITFVQLLISKHQ